MASWWAIFLVKFGHFENSEHQSVSILVLKQLNSFCMWCSGQLILLTDWVDEGIRRTIQQRSSSSLFCRRPCEQFWHGQGCPLFDVDHPAFPLPTTASPTLQGALKDVLESMSRRVSCLNHASFRLLTVVRRGFYGPTRKLISLRIQSFVLCCK